MPAPPLARHTGTGTIYGSMPSTAEPSSRFASETEPLVFRDVGRLLADPDNWAAWLEEHSDRAPLFQDAFNCVIRLSSHTGMTENRVLSLIGCEAQGNLSALPSRQLEQCTHYLRWAETLIRDLDLHTDKRLALAGAGRFFFAADRDLDLCTRIMTQAPFGPSDYLQLGEVSQAWETAFRALPGPLGDRARALHDANPFSSPSTPHLSLKRVEMMRSPNAGELLGIRVAVRMDAHLRSCPDCAPARHRN